MYTRLLWVAAASLLLTLTPAIAKPYLLKCTTKSGEPAADLIVDLERRVMTWGMAVPNYIITKITDRYITAIENEDVMASNVGGEVWVLGRVTGDYQRASVGMFCKDASCRTGFELEANTYFGRCVHAIL